MKGRSRNSTCIAIVAAAGEGSRLRSPVRKALVDLGGEPLLIRTVRALSACPLIGGIIVALHPADTGRIKRDYGKALHELGVEKIVSGGTTRSETVDRALRQLPTRADLVAIHDVARPFVERSIIEAVVRRARRTGAAIIAVPAKETVKERCSPGSFRTLQRSRLWLVQTPQVFRKDLIRKAYHHWRLRGGSATDDSQLVEALGERVAVVRGNEANFKITTPYDLKVARLIVEANSGTLST